MANKVNAAAFVKFLTERCAKKDGYLMGGQGQYTKNLTKSSYLITQYKGNTSQYNKALYWLANAERVWDCNGLAEGYYKDQTGVSIDTRARYNYSGWCSPKGTGSIPNQYKIPGAAVFIYSSSSGYITHVGFLEKPVDASKPNGDWYIIEARGVMYGVVRTKYNGRGWNRWGLMTKYFDYGNSSNTGAAAVNDTPRTLKKGMTGNDVKVMQEALIKAGYDLGKYRADGDFGADTEKAVKQFQKDQGLEVDGIVGPTTWAAIDKLAAGVTSAGTATITVTGATVNVRTLPNTTGAVLGVAKLGEKLSYRGEEKDGWYAVRYKDKDAWISGKYAKRE